MSEIQKAAANMMSTHYINLHLPLIVSAYCKHLATQPSVELHTQTHTIDVSIYELKHCSSCSAVTTAVGRGYVIALFAECLLI